MKKRLDIHEGIIIGLVLFTIMGIFIPGQGLDDLILALLSVSSFLFGIFVAFSISDRQNRLKEIRTILRGDDGALVNIYELSQVFSKDSSNKIKKLIDNWLTSTIDYELEDFQKSESKFLKLFEYIRDLKPKTKKQKVIYGELLDILQDTNKSNQKMNYLVNDKISTFEWGTILVLGLIILFCLFFINMNTWPSIIIIVLLSVALITILLVLRDLDTLFWKEQKWIWDPLAELFKELDLLPYYAEELVELKRVKIKKGEKYRIGLFKGEYPNRKKIKIKICTA